MYSVSDLKQDLTGTLHGTQLSEIVGLDVLINRAARKLLTDCDPMETIRIVPITSPIFDRIYDYAIPDDLKGDRIIDIRPQVNRTPADRFVQTYNEPFDAYKAATFGHPMFTIQYNTAVKSVRIEKNLPMGVLVNGVTAVTGDNGTWTATGNAIALEEDNVNFVYGSASVKWDVSAGADPSNAGIETVDMDPIDLSVQSEQGSLFLYVFLPTPLAANNCTLNWGSDASNYWTRTVAVTQFNTTFQQGWNLLQFDWHHATQVGTPDASAVSYLGFSVNYDGALDFAYRLNDITCQLGNIYQMEYYSKYLFRDATTGAFQENISDDSNLINLDTDSYNLLFDVVAFYCAQQVQGADSGFDAQYWQGEYTTALARYVAKIKSQILKPTQTYYKMQSGRRWTRVRPSSS